MIIDVHAHALDEAFLSDLTRRSRGGLRAEADGRGGFRVARAEASWTSLDPLLHQQERRLESLARRKVDRQYVAPPPGFLGWAGGATDVELAAALNRHCAAIASQASATLVPMATIAFGEPNEALAAFERAIGEHGFHAAIIPTTAGDRPLDDPIFDPIFSLAEQRGILLLMHPTVPAASDRFGIYGIQVLVGLPFETTLAITRMIFAGFFERHPNLKLLLAHGGGNLVYMRGRLGAAYNASGWEANSYYKQHTKRAPSGYLQNLFYDTCVVDPQSLQFLITAMGAERVLFGTDYPFEIGDPEGRQALLGLEAVEPAARENVMGLNVERILTRT
jgi:aminocarboxymuconate-semialdehyde decarboxylase